MSEALQRFDPLLVQLRRHAWRRALPWAIAAAFAAGAAALSLDGASAPVLGALAGVCTLVLRRLRDPLWLMGAADLAAHFDRRFPELEESSALLLADESELPVLQRLQRARIEPHWPQVVAAPQRWLPVRRLTGPLLLAALGLGFCALTLLPDGQDGADSGQDSTPVTAAAAPLQLENLRVEPPAYTGLAPFSSESFDVEFPEGSQLAWTFAPRADDALRLVIGDAQGGERAVAVESGDASLRARATVSRTSLYRVEAQSDAGFVALPGIHTLTAILDRPPRLRVLEPQRSRLEVPPEGAARFSYRVSISDDYGIDSAWILASVAKGSGEGVKFRDQRFAFAGVVEEDGRQVHEQRFDLAELGMEPGDEVYLFTVARDARSDVPNEGRSDTLVVRWLDEAVALEAAEGLAISVMPEYFKSQRQIIIETEQLIADREALSRPVFEETSRDLGQAQSDLKERYGQYLGDEFGEGESPFETGGAGVGNPADDTAGEHDEHEGHDHEHSEARGPDTSGSAADLVARFAHDHGGADIGPITRRNPVGLMKRSIDNMWQAELQLRLADPEAALPFEYEALRYFDLARQADRIYTQRLGFEPPPVTEERRLSGELDDITSRRERREANPDPSSLPLLRDLHRLLNSTAEATELGEPQRDLLRRASRDFTARAGERPALIGAAAKLERLAISGQFTLPDCEGCLDALRAATWSLLPPARPAPDPGRRPALDSLAVDYLERLRSLSAQPGPAGNARVGERASP